MQRRHSIASLAAALAVACFDAGEAPAPPAPGALAGATAPAAPAPRATASAASQRKLRQELTRWMRAAKSGTLLLRSDAGAELTPGPVLETDVEIAVTGLLARAVVRQRFTNPGDTWAEGIYVFPLPDDAAVDHMRIYTEVRVLEGQIQEKQEARKTYERAKQAGRHAGLVEQERPNVFTTYVANIRPGGEVSVEIEYQQSVQLDQGEFSVRFPTVVGPRYVPGQPLSEGPDPGTTGTAEMTGTTGTGWSRDTDRVPDASRVTPPVRRPERGSIHPVRIRVDLAPGFEVDRLESPYHPIRVDEAGEGYRVALAGGPVPADRDFELRWTPMPGEQPGAAFFTEAHGGDHYALLLVTPPHQPGSQPEPPPREAVYVIDTSGSMAGDSLTQAKRALTLALEHLRPDDRFNVIEFNSATKALFPGSLAASRGNVERALQYVRGLHADGGTEILPAIRLALAGQPPGQHLLRQVVFLTDGSVANETELFEAIRDELGQSRLFAVGIGSAPNTHFMRKAAQLGRGSFTHIGKPDEVAEKMTGLFRKLESVVLADIELELPTGDAAEQTPGGISDLSLGEPVVVALKLDEPLDWVGVRGRTGSAPWQVTLDSGDALERPGIHVLWARRKIGALMDARLGVRDERMLRDLRDDTVGVALEHHLMSAYTSLVAVDVTPERRGYEPLRSHALEIELPAGWSFESGFGMATTATAADLRIALGLLLVAAGGISGRLRVAA